MKDSRVLEALSTRIDRQAMRTYRNPKEGHTSICSSGTKPGITSWKWGKPIVTYSLAMFKWLVSKTQGFSFGLRRREEVLFENRKWLRRRGEYIRRRASKSGKFSHRPTNPFSQRCHHFLEMSYHYSFFLPFPPLGFVFCDAERT